MSPSKNLALFDLDKTIYKNHSFFELAKYEVDRGRVSQETWEDIQKLLELYETGKKPYSETANHLLKTYANSLKGLNEEDLYSDTLEYFQLNEENFFDYFGETVQLLGDKYDLYIVTTNAQYIARAVCEIYGLDGFISSQFGVKNEKFTGEVEDSLADGKHMVSSLLEKYGFENSIAVGDSENDISMLELVEYPICINSSEALESHAKKNRWRIVSGETMADVIQEILEQS